MSSWARTRTCSETFSVGSRRKRMFALGIVPRIIGIAQRSREEEVARGVGGAAQVEVVEEVAAHAQVAVQLQELELRAVAGGGGLHELARRLRALDLRPHLVPHLVLAFSTSRRTARGGSG